MNEVFKMKTDEFIVRENGITIKNRLINMFFPYGSFEKVTFSAMGLAIVVYNGKKYGFSCEIKDLGRMKKAVQYAIEKNANTPRTNPVQLDDSEIFVGHIFDGGAGDILKIEDEYVIIQHKGVLNALAMGIKGDKTIYYEDITAIEYGEPRLGLGRIQFSIHGGRENVGGLFAAAGDENTISVASDKGIEAGKVVEYLHNKLREVKKSAKSNNTIVQQVSQAEELKKFKDLLDSGIITQEEFDAKKKQLLGL